MKENKDTPFKSPWKPTTPRDSRHSSIALTLSRKGCDGKPIEFVLPLGLIKWTPFTPDELAVRIANEIGNSVVSATKVYCETHPGFLDSIFPKPEVPAAGTQEKTNTTKQGKQKMAIKKAAAKKAVKKAVKAPAKKTVKVVAKKAPAKKGCCCKCGKKTAKK